MDTPWTILQGAISRLADRVDAFPSIREATVITGSPLTILFDTDVNPTVPYASLVTGLTTGSRVLTLKLRHYVWVLGMRGGAPVSWSDLLGDVATVKKMRLTSVSDVSLGSTEHAFQIGPDNDSLIFDSNEIQSRLNGIAAWLGLNAEGGDVVISADGSTITLNGKVRLTNVGDASAGSTGHAFQIGPDNGFNTIIDNNEIIFRNNGVQVAQVLSSTSNIPWSQIVDSIQTITGTSAIVAASGWSVDTQSITIKNGIAVAFMNFTRTGAAITVPASGNIANTTFATIPNASYRPGYSGIPISLISGGPLLGGEVTTGGDFRINAIAPGNTIATGTAFNCGAMWPI